MSGNTAASDPVVIAVDPHKASWTAAAVDSALRPLATIRVPVSHAGYQQLRRFAARWPTAVWAIEGAGGLGAGCSALDASVAPSGILAGHA